MLTPNQQLAELWQELGLPAESLSRIRLSGQEPVFPSSFAVGSAALVSIAASAGAAVEIATLRGLEPQTIDVDMLEAAIECTGHFLVNGKETPKFAELSGLYQCNDGWLRIHANFDHHRDAALRVTGLAIGPNTQRSALEAKTLNWGKQALEEAILKSGGACAVVRSFDEWDNTSQAKAVAKLPVVEITKIGDAEPLSVDSLTDKQQPLNGIRVLDLTRILAGPVCGRTLAAYGADTMLINSPELPNIDAIIETSRGKLSALIDLTKPADKNNLHQLIKGAHAFVQGYRPGSLSAYGLTPEALAEIRPGIVYTSLSAYGRSGPWADRRGFDSLLQSASGINRAEASAIGSDKPAALPMQILDYASGFLMAFGTQVALARQLTEGGSWHVQVSLARTGLWLRSMGQNSEWLDCETPDANRYLQSYPSDWGSSLEALAHPPRFSHSEVRWNRPSTPPGTHLPAWD